MSRLTDLSSSDFVFKIKLNVFLLHFDPVNIFCMIKNFNQYVGYNINTAYQLNDDLQAQALSQGTPQFFHTL